MTRTVDPVQARGLRTWRAAVVWAVALAAVAPEAHADTYAVETLGSAHRAEAEELLAQLHASEVEATLVRTFRRGLGWVFVVRIEGLAEKDLARERAELLSDLAGQAVRGFLVAGKDVLPLDELSVQVGGSAEGTQAAAGGDAEPPGNDEDAARKGAELLAAVLLAHGGAVGQGGEQARGSPWRQVHFRFERELTTPAGGLRVAHEVWRLDDAVRVDVRVLDGQGKDSVAAVRSGQAAWLRVDGALHEVPEGPTREGLLAFCPEAVLEQALAIRSWAAGLPAVQVGGPADAGGLAWIELDAGEGGERVLLGVDPGDRRVRQILTQNDVEIRWRFYDYQELPGGIVLPFRAELLADGTALERITVRQLDLGASIDVAAFDPPR